MLPLTAGRSPLAMRRRAVRWCGFFLCPRRRRKGLCGSEDHCFLRSRRDSNLRRIQKNPNDTVRIFCILKPPKHVDGSCFAARSARRQVTGRPSYRSHAAGAAVPSSRSHWLLRVGAGRKGSDAVLFVRRAMRELRPPAAKGI